MATIIDSLVVELGLDPSKFTKGAREAFDAAKRLEQDQLRSARNVEEGAKRANDSFSELRTTGLKVFAAITGSAGLVQFATQAIHAGAVVGRLSRNLNVSGETIQRFQNLAKTFGGSAEGMAQSFTEISDALTGWKMGDVRPIIAEFRQLGAVGGTIIDINKGVEQSFKDIETNLRAIHDKDPALAGYWQRRINMDPGIFDAIIQKRARLNELLRETNVLTEAEIKAAGELEQRWNKFTVNATKAGQSFVLDTVDKKAPFLGADFNPFTNGSDAKDIETIKRWWNKLFGSSPASAAPVPPPAPSTSKAFTSTSERAAFVRAEAAKRGINPNVAFAVAKGEGLDNFVGDNGTSFGAFQLHVTPGGKGRAVGDQFREKTGLDPSDPKNERETIKFALDDALRNGWTAYHGAARVGIGQWHGLPQGGNVSNSTVNINGPISITAGAGADGTKIAQDFRSELIKRQSDVALANNGQQ